MSEHEFATAAELAELSKGEAELTLKTVPGKKIKIRKATIGELADIIKVAKESELEQSFLLTYKCMVQPKVNLEEIKTWPPAVLIEIGNGIAKFSGIDRKSMDQVQNLLDQES